MSVQRYEQTEGGICKDEEGSLVDYDDFLELSQLASKLLKMSTYHLLSTEERKRFNELTEGCNDG